MGLRSNQMEEMHMARYVGRAQSFQALSTCVTLPKSPHVHSLENLSKPPPLWFFWRLYYIDTIG